MEKKNNLLILGAFIALGLIVLGISINSGLRSFSNKERVVTVKGLAEQYMKATDATIAISVSFTGDEPKSLTSMVNGKIAKITEYLKSKGYNTLITGNLYIYDSKSYYEERWNGDNYVKVKKDRYRASRDITIKLKDVEKAADITNSIDNDLINRDLSSDVTCSYAFPELNSIKPQLIAESTKNARAAGEQFAKDSKSKLGKIKTATQGQISIAGQYYDEEDSNATSPSEPYLQKARVVSTIVFFLED